MNCDFYRRHELGKISDADFDRHALNCEACRKLIDLDATVLAEARGLKQAVAAPLLWPKIENSLRAERQARHRVLPTIFLSRHAVILRLAAVLVVAMGIGAYFLLRPEPGSGRLLAGKALKQVEAKEREYQEAIAGLEQMAEPQMEKLDADLMMLYRDRLQTIDAQIDRCKEAIAQNPANAHIRRYLLAALQDKQQTLKEILEFRSM
jgi:hypothetical protein